MNFKNLILILVSLAFASVSFAQAQTEYYKSYSKARELAKSSSCESKEQARVILEGLENEAKPYHLIDLAEVLLAKTCDFYNPDKALQLLEISQGKNFFYSFEMAGWFYLNKNNENFSPQKALDLFKKEYSLSSTSRSAFGISLAKYILNNQDLGAYCWATKAIELGDERGGVLYLVFQANHDLKTLEKHCSNFQYEGAM